ncbi:Hypothetical protein NTJ_16224 [Nesidiocoris tenuis]|uniref:MADF domain-containing protein n=1 Tax=Nesidiocoris tenuis TaxID=355587 RepID=A0ABN7BGB2_9HEMI|nr:Hypothetical protein NTJ_16224 [Nesidiocoris tenuis]
MAGQTNQHDCIILSDEDSIDTTSVQTTPSNSSPKESKNFDKFLKTASPSSSAVSDTAAGSEDPTCTQTGVPQEQTALVEPKKPSGSLKVLESMLTQMMGEMPPAQLAEVAKHAMIDIVRQFPPLWKSNNEYYHNNKYCALLWTNIAGVLNISVTTAKIRWRKLRDLYKKEYLKSERTGIESQHPLFQRLNFLKEEILLIKQRADKLRGAVAKPPTSAGTHTANHNTALPDDNNDADDDDDDDCMIINLDLNDERRDDRKANENEARKPSDKPTSSTEPTLPVIHPRKLSELQTLLRSPSDDINVPSSSYYTKESVQKNAKRKSRSRSPETGAKLQKVPRAGSPRSLSPEIEYDGEAIKSKIFLTHTFPDITWKKTPPQVMDSSITSNTPVEKAPTKISKIKSTARKSTGAQYLPKSNLNPLCSSSTQAEERPPPQPECNTLKSAKKIDVPKAKNISGIISSSEAKKVTPKRTVPTKAPAESVEPAPADETPKNVEAPASLSKPEIGPSPLKVEIESNKTDLDKSNDASDWGKENENFLLSLLPEVNSMTDKQFRKFRTYSSALISLILDGE